MNKATYRRASLFGCLAPDTLASSAEIIGAGYQLGLVNFFPGLVYLFIFFYCYEIYCKYLCFSMVLGDLCERVGLQRDHNPQFENGCTRV